jgi:hypothetical protein
VHTLEQARLADLPVRLVCSECGHFQQMHAFALLQKLSAKRRSRPVNLLEPLPGFYCRGCKRSVRAVISAPILAA